MARRPMILVGGKGGVGKTTCAAGLAAAAAASGRPTLIITSDATPSLSDIFELPIGDRITEVDRNLFALEISPEAVTERWRRKFGPDFYEVLSRFIDLEKLDEGSRHQFMDYIASAPALKEETLLDLIRETAAGGRFEQIVWDTAPAGETLNLLKMPALLKKHIKAGARVYQLLDRLGRRITGQRSIPEIMERWIRLSDELSAFIHTEGAFVVVATPEVLVVRQARRLMDLLRGYDVPIRGLIINRVMEFPDSEALRAASRRQDSHIRELREIAKDLPVTALPFSTNEIRGAAVLKSIGEKPLRELGL